MAETGLPGPAAGLYTEPMSDTHAPAGWHWLADQLQRLVEQGPPPRWSDWAEAAGLSERHWRRLFTQGAGCAPERLAQYLRAGQAGGHLRAAQADQPLFDLSLELGFSGPGRLHDLTVTYEALSPGELKQGGAGAELTWGWASTPLGPARAVWTPRGLWHLGWPEGGPGGAPAGPGSPLRDTPRGPDPDLGGDPAPDLPQARRRRDDSAAQALWNRIFGLKEAGGGATAPGARPSVEGADGHPAPPLHLLLHGTTFQIRVWEALLTIPPGQTARYGELAARLGRPGAARAVGGAVGANPFAPIIPCHRVIHRLGGQMGYRWGVWRKQVLLAGEALPV